MLAAWAKLSEEVRMIVQGVRRKKVLLDVRS